MSYLLQQTLFAGVVLAVTTATTISDPKGLQLKPAQSGYVCGQSVSNPQHPLINLNYFNNYFTIYRELSGNRRLKQRRPAPPQGSVCLYAGATPNVLVTLTMLQNTNASLRVNPQPGKNSALHIRPQLPGGTKLAGKSARHLQPARLARPSAATDARPSSATLKTAGNAALSALLARPVPTAPVYAPTATY